ncbi:MAG TPA: type II toxin-antitoxin system HicB family antitoxin [Chloroflexota bacterium]|nr:type II toxin-antitoxin system HicB family antitoxin [Chloroflexota bacterium]
MNRQFSIVLEPELEDGGYSVAVPALPGCRTQGESVEECIERAREAIAAWIADAQANGDPIPSETIRPQVVTIDVAA